MIDWNKIDTVLLDMDGTLLDLHFDNHFWQEYVIQRYAETHNKPIDIVKPQLLELMDNARGTLEWYCLDYWSRELQLDIIALKRELEHLIKLHPHAEDFLKTMQGRCPLALVTNAHPQALALKLERTGIETYFDTIISSHEFKKPKETQEFWSKLQAKLKFKPDKTLLIEDSVPILKAAQQFGIGQLLAISRPDSRRNKNNIDHLPNIENFGEILTTIP